MPRSSRLVPFAFGAALIGALEAVRLGSAGLALSIVPVFAFTGLLAGTVVAIVARISTKSLVLALPTAIVTVPVARTAFDGAYAQTLPLAVAMPYVAPVVAWL